MTRTVSRLIAHHFLMALFAIAVVFSSGAGAASGELSAPFTEARFKALQAENQLVLVDVAADWCPTCRRQHAAISSIQKQHPELKLHVLSVDFDSQKEWVRYFKAPRQSTLILFKGSDQRWFAVAETREEVILDELQKAASSPSTPTKGTAAPGA